MRQKVQVLWFNTNLIPSRQRVPRPSYPFRGKLGDQVKGRSPRKLKSLIVVHYVAHLKIQVLSCNMNLISSPQLSPGPIYAFRGKFGRSGKGSFTEKAKISQRASLCIARERTCSRLQYDPYLILCSVFLDRLIHFGETLGDQVKDRSPKKLKNVN